MKVACIGSRETPEDILAGMEWIGKIIVQQNWWLASGNALGADAAYARGGNSINPKKVMLYLPWSTYNDELIVPGNVLVTKVEEEWIDIAARHHPRYPLLSKGAQSMMIRNAGIVRNADLVIAYLNNRKQGGGGTGHGWRIAETYDIPRFDLSKKKDQKGVLDHIVELVKKEIGSPARTCTETRPKSRAHSL